MHLADYLQCTFVLFLAHNSVTFRQREKKKKDYLSGVHTCTLRGQPEQLKFTCLRKAYCALSLEICQVTES